MKCHASQPIRDAYTQTEQRHTNLIMPLSGSRRQILAVTRHMAPFDLDACIDQLLRKQLLHEALLREICEKTKEVLMRESNVVHVTAPVTVVGDIHGSVPPPPPTPTTSFSVRRPPPRTPPPLTRPRRLRRQRPLQRRNNLPPHLSQTPIPRPSPANTRQPRVQGRNPGARPHPASPAAAHHAQTYGFYTECVRKYGSSHVWTYFTDMFDFLTLSVVIEDRIFCVHGGPYSTPVLSPAHPPPRRPVPLYTLHRSDQGRRPLSRSVPTVLHLRPLNPAQKYPTRVPWRTSYGQTPIQTRRILPYPPGTPLFVPRVPLLIACSGAGYTFGSGVVRKFLETNHMSHILRAHQLCMEGYSVLFDNHLSTVWSAPNYCYRCGNSASILEVGPGEGSMHFNVFEAAPENERDGPSHQTAQNNGGKVRGFLDTSGHHFLTEYV